MWLSAEITLSSYLPQELEAGMLFVNRISVGVIDPYIELFELEEIPEDMDEFMSKHGAPVELLVVDYDENVLATQDELGWWDDGDETDEYRDVTLDDINYLLREYDGYVDVEVDDDEDVVFIEDKIIIALIPDEEKEAWDEFLNEEPEDL